MLKFVIDNLQQERLLRWQLIIYIYFNRIYANITNMCQTAYTRAVQPKPLYNLWSDNNEPLKSIVTTDNQNVKLKPAAANNQLDWCLPPLPTILGWYQHFSTGIMIYVATINIFPVDSYVGFLLGPFERPDHCYVPGKIVLYSTFPKAVPVFFSLAHLAWRLKMHQKFKRPKLNMVEFMLLNKRLLEQEQDRVAKKMKLGTRRGFNAFQLYLSDILYLPYEFRGRLFYLLRCNRTLDAHHSIAEFTSQCSVAIAVALTLGTCLILPIILLSLFRDLTYVDRYPACSPWLEEQMAKQAGQLSWASMTFGDSYKLSLNLLDLIVNLVFWFDSAAAPFIILPSTYLLNFDLLYYWQKIGSQLAQVDQELKLKWFLEEEEKDLGWPPLTRQPLDRVKHNHRHLEAICKLQAQLVDFFAQLRRVDEQVSDIVSASIVVWLFIFSFGTLYFIAFGSESLAKEVRAIQVALTIGLAVQNLFLLSLRRALYLSYRRVCSVMAYDQSHYKRRFTKILDYWSPQHGHASYTLFNGSFPFTSTTILSLIGWGISLALVGESFLKRY